MGSKSFESWIWNAHRVSIGEVFLQHQLWIVNYYVKSLSNNLIIENIRAGVSREMIMIFQKKSFWHFNSHLSWKQQCLCFHYGNYLTNFWQKLTINNWRSIKTWLMWFQEIYLLKMKGFCYQNWISRKEI